MGGWFSSPEPQPQMDEVELKAREMFRRGSKWVAETEAMGYKIIAAQLWVDADSYARFAAIGGFSDGTVLRFAVIYYGGGEEVAVRDLDIANDKAKTLIKRTLKAIDSASERCMMGKGCRTFLGVITDNIKSSLIDQNAFKLQDMIKSFP